MNKQIKFRGVHAVTGEMVFGQFVKTDYPSKTEDYDFTDCWIVEERVTVDFCLGDHMRSLYVYATPIEECTEAQFTGVYDNDGVEIFTNDIIQDHLGIGVVEYIDHRAAFRVNYLNGECKWFIDYILKGERESIKVVGNVHQNNGLLNKEK